MLHPFLPCLFAWLLAAPSLGSDPSPRPNVVLIIADDQGWSDYGFMGHSDIRTPSLDRLAERSLVFERGYVTSPLCRPSLASIATGLYPHQHGAVANDVDPARRAESDAPVQRAFHERPSLIRELTRAGYLTHQSGKWWEGSFADGGFTHGMTHGDPGRGGRHGDEGLRIGREGLGPVTDFIDEAVARERPFFVWYAPFLPHTPHDPPEELLREYRAEGRAENVARYFAMCAWFDRTCGELLAHLERRELLDDTLVAFVCDNGWAPVDREAENPPGWWPDFAPRSKGSPFEGGIRTPILIAWPGRVEPGRSEDLASSVDLMPTLLRACGVEVPAGLPGIDLLDGEARARREAIFGASYSIHNMVPGDPGETLQYRWCISGDWKLLLRSRGSDTTRYATVHEWDRTPARLWNLREDPREQRDALRERPGVAARLRARIEAWLPEPARAEAPLPQVPAELPDPDGRPGDATKPVQVYLLAGQSNMVGMGEISGAKNRYSGVFLTPDPAAPEGPLSIYTVGNYRIRPLAIFRSADAGAEPGATASVYFVDHDPALDYDELQPERTLPVALGVVGSGLPADRGPCTVVVRGFLEVPESGRYTVHPGFGASARNVAKIDGQEVYRRETDAPAALQPIALEAGRRHALEITYFASGSLALWLSQEDLLGKGDLESVVKRDGKFPHLVDDAGEWTLRHDVWYQEARLAKDGAGSLLGPTSNGKTIGPELQFGHVLGTFHDEQVLLIETSQGNRSLGYDFRPPSSGRNDPDSEWESAEYRLMVEGVRKTLDRIDEIVPGYRGQGYEIVGFAWWQGHKDGSPEAAAEYEQNLVHLIQDVRAEFGVPRLPVVVATVGFHGHDMDGVYLQILEAQLAVGDPERHPEFAGTVASVDTRDFWREVDDSPADQDYHYNRNAETYLLVGDALGRAMVRLRGGTAEPLPEAPRAQPVASVSPANAAAGDEAAAQAALAPMLLDGVARAYVSDPRNAARLASEARGEAPERPSQFLRGALFGLRTIHRTAGIDDYDWRPFGPDLRDVEWDSFSFDPAEVLPLERPNRYRVVTWPVGMEDWRTPGFDAAAAGWRRSLPPFGQLDGELAPLSESCTAPFCGCSEAPRTLWEKEVLLIRGTFSFPPLDPSCNYRLVVGGSAHVNAGEGFAVFVDGKLLAASTAGVGKRQGGQPRGGHVTSELREEFADGEVTIGVHSFLRYNTPRGPQPPRGHLTVWMEEAKIPPLEEGN